MTKHSKSTEPSNSTKPVLSAVIDEQVKKLSNMQVDLMSSGFEVDDFNDISEMIGNLKEFMVNCRSYNGR